ncbi:MAG: HD domain-containing protein [Candidatus Zixiibacteriota bacterium]
MDTESQEGDLPAGESGEVTLATLAADGEVAAYLAEADRVLGVLGYTEHGAKHARLVAEGARAILEALGYKGRRAELAAIAGYLHDIGNTVNRENHEMISAVLCHSILLRLGMDLAEVLQVMTAIGNHDEGNGEPVSAISAALTLADKADVRRDRVRNPSMISFDVHDRVNYAAKGGKVEVDAEAKVITLKVEIDTSISQVMEYFETFLSRMIMCRRAARHLGCNFGLVINDVRML